MRGCLTMGTTLGLVLAASAFAQPPEYHPAPAEVLKARGGLGNVVTKLAAGADVRVAYFGGSITAADGWRVQTLEWFRAAYPQATVNEINAAIGGTGSDLGAFRYGQDVLSRDPDLVFIEFAVNDGGAPPEAIWRQVEGIIRQTWTADPGIDLCFVYTFRTGYEADLRQGLCPQAASADEALADYYGIPSINVALPIVEMERDGRLLFVPERDADGNALDTPEGVTLFSTDGVHPGDDGHRIYTDTVAQAIATMADGATAAPHALPEPFVADNWERATLVPLRPEMLSPGWRKLGEDDWLFRSFSHRMPEMWEATRPGEKITFRFRGATVMLYDILGPDGGQAVCTVDGVTQDPRPRFDSYCSYHRIATLWIASGLEDAEHTVTIEIHPDQPDRSSVTDREKEKPDFDPAKYDGTAMRVGGILLIGEVL